ncbi:hypothetical protein [Methylomarinum vadi]|uniref:hypothetical protein n=1 Tax=Methylomarinum vadi TaxID=438855 RepID=UPI000A05A116|nr:hypothetical protein [Methylomarinum vadi]
MNRQLSMSKSLTILKILLQVNFNASVIFLMIVSVFSLSGSDFFFADLGDLYGPLSGNLRIMFVYLCLTEIAVYSYCHFSNNNQGIMLLGLFLLMLIASLQFYGYVNEIPIDNDYNTFFLYLGLSHILFGAFSRRNHSDDESSR